jgi:hypothetical protein
VKIPSKLPITAEQSRAARFQLGLTQANVIEQSELAGHKLKNFETGRFVPDMAFLQSMRTFYESRGIDFSDADAKPANTDAQKPTLGVGIVAPMQTSRFVVDPALPQEQVDSILERMDSNDVRIAELMNCSLESGLFSSYTEKTDADTKELFGLMAENYLLFRTLQGRNILAPLPEKSVPKSQAELISSLYSTALLVGQQPDEKSDEEEGELV